MKFTSMLVHIQRVPLEKIFSMLCPPARMSLWRQGRTGLFGQAAPDGHRK